MVHFELYQSIEVQEAILKQLKDEDIKKFFYEQVLPWFKHKYYLHQIAEHERMEVSFWEEVKYDMARIYMHFYCKIYYDDNQYTTPYDFGLGFSLFNIFKSDGFGDIFGEIKDGEELAKEWMKFLKEKIPDYAPVLEKYRAKLTKRVKKENARKIKEIEQENEKQLNELNDSFPEN